MNKEPIDIVITWVNPKDKEWEKEFLFYKKKHVGKSNEVSNHESRYRDLDTLKYVFRSIEKNAKFIRNVYLVLAYESQIPEWLDVNNEQLKIIYHRDIIDKKYLPTFNSITIEFNICNIDGLSNNFILSNDDMFFIKETDESDCFIDDLPVDYVKQRFNNPYRYNVNSEFRQTINNNLKLIEEITGIKTDYNYSHVFCMYNKDFTQWVLEKYPIIKKKSCTKFRTPTNYTHWLLKDLRIVAGKYVEKPVISRSLNIAKLDIDITKELRIQLESKFLCLNDTEIVEDFINKKKITIFILNSLFPEKSKFEK